jgi:hypothetical protein
LFGDLGTENLRSRLKCIYREAKAREARIQCMAMLFMASFIHTDHESILRVVRKFVGNEETRIMEPSASGYNFI